jgi:hypothetical protein
MVGSLRFVATPVHGIFRSILDILAFAKQAQQPGLRPKSIASEREIVSPGFCRRSGNIPLPGQIRVVASGDREKADN